MALFSKTGIAESRIENSGRWPVRLTRFQLIDEYEFPATNFPEIFFVEAGTFVHESEAGAQSVREGAAVMANPGHRHTVKRPDGVVLTRVRYLPEWFALDYEIVARSPDLLGLFFDQSWFCRPCDESIHVFTTRGENAARIRSEVQYLQGLLREKRHFESVVRVSMLKLMALLADEHRRFWRGVPDLEILPEAAHALDHIEACVHRGEPFTPGKMPRGGYERQAVEKAFGDLTGLSLADYALRRRAFHAAFRLLTGRAEPRRLAKVLGWSSPGEFSEQFEAVFDLPPTVYRERFGLSAAERKEEVEED